MIIRKDKNVVQRMIRRVCASHPDLEKPCNDYYAVPLLIAREHLNLQPGERVAVDLSGGDFACRDMPIVSGPYETQSLTHAGTAIYYEIPGEWHDPGDVPFVPFDTCCRICGKTLWELDRGFLEPVRAYIAAIFLMRTTTMLLLRKREEALNGS